MRPMEMTLAHRWEPTRRLSRSLAGYLCGSHSGVARRRGARRLPPALIAQAHQRLAARSDDDPTLLGAQRWDPDRERKRLANGLRTALNVEGVVELVLFGSQARGGTTGFSDVDALLIIEDALVEEPGRLRALRPRVLAAERAILRHQPMQHHELEVVTPKLLQFAHSSLGLPPQALSDTRSLFGRPAAASWGADHENAARLARVALSDLAGGLLSARHWPRHPWLLHRLVSMFELLPALYLQSRDRSVPKWESFSAARAVFGPSWWPYEVLEQVRAVWPRRPRRGLETVTIAARNPWPVVAAWSRIPAAPPAGVASLLDDECLAGLQEICRRAVAG